MENIMNPIKQLKAICIQFGQDVRKEKKNSKQTMRNICKEYQDNGIMPSPYDEHDQFNSVRHEEYQDHFRIFFNEQEKLHTCKRLARMFHVAYSELRGRTRAQIEPSSITTDYKGNMTITLDYDKQSQEHGIKKIKDEWTEKIESWKKERQVA